MKLSAAFCLSIGLLFTLFSHGSAELVAHYTLDEAVAPTIDSIAGAGVNNATDIGTPTRGQPGIFGTAYSFDSDPDSGLDLGTTSAVTPTGDFTITLWANLTGTGSNERLVDASNNTAAITNGFRIMTGGSGDNDHIRFLAEDGPDGDSTDQDVVATNVSMKGLSD